MGLDKIAKQVGNHKFSVQLEKNEALGEYTQQLRRIKTEPFVQIKLWLLKPKKDGPFPLALFPHGHDKCDYNTFVDE